MLTRIRIEVSDEDSARTAEEALDRYENAITTKNFPGREVTDEVIEYDPSLPGYKGRRAVVFRRIDIRSQSLTATS
jgi:hypothetical protein